MIVFNEKEQYGNFINPEEVQLHTRAVSRGIGIGKAICLKDDEQKIYKSNLTSKQIEQEVLRFTEAHQTTKEKLDKIKSSSDIFNTHILILEDNSLIENIKENIVEKRLNAEWAVKKAFDEYIKRFQQSDNDLFKERIIDLQDIKEGVLRSLNGTSDKSIEIPYESIVIIDILKPTTLIEMAKFKPKALITERGGWTSHSFILARDLGIPAVTGVKKIFDRFSTGDEIVVDGFSGQVYINPEHKTIEHYKNNAPTVDSEIIVEDENLNVNTKTLDGQEIIIRANLDLTVDFGKAEKFGAKGVGLYRSEYLFTRANKYPSEEEQVENYSKIGKIVGENEVNIRTFDLSIEQIDKEVGDRQSNPALGLRGIRLSLSEEKEFRTQIRAILRASFEHNINIVLPMISSVSEIIVAKKKIEDEKQVLNSKNIKFGEPKIGVMIEVPSAIFTIEEIVQESDFLNLGTNDLVQYILAVDRDDESVADLFKTLHPAVLIAVEKVFKAAEKYNIPTIVCGEMAGSPFYAPILIGLGARQMSMNVNSISRMKRTISGIALEEALEIVKEIKQCRTTEEIEEKLCQSFITKWSHLCSNEILSTACDTSN